MYHNVFNESTTGIIGKNEFEAHIKYIKDKKTFKMEELKSLNYHLPKNSILVTFDDGYKNNFDYLPFLLEKYDLKATILISSPWRIGKVKICLSLPRNICGISANAKS